MNLKILRQFLFWIISMLLFFGALFWAKKEDPFSRKWFTLKPVEHNAFKCVAIMPKPLRQYPVIIYAHGSGGTLMNDGNDLRQMAELGLATVSLEYDQSDEAVFRAQFESLLHFLDHQKWANTNAIAWVGSNLGANQMLDFALQHPQQQPQLLVQISGSGITEASLFLTHALGKGVANLHCRFLLIHGEKDENFPVTDSKRLVSILQTNNLPVELIVIPRLPHGLEPERSVIARCIGEYCLTHLAGRNALQNYHSIAQWQAEAPPLWLFWLPALTWVGGWFAWSLYRTAAPPELVKLSRAEIALRWAAFALATWALAETTLHLVPLQCSVTDTTISIARRFLVQPQERADFEFLAGKPIWQCKKLKTLLNCVELAGYNRELINWQLDDKEYKEFVLSPVIIGNAGEQLDWRRLLWEEFYPRIRHESSPEDAVKIVVRHLRERVTISILPNPSHDVPDIWLKQITDETGFEIIYVAALRSVGVPARLNSNHNAEFWDGITWQVAPEPSVLSW